MSTSWNVILKRLGVVFAVVLVLFGITMLFTYDVITMWVSFMGLSPAMQQMEHPLPVATESIPIEGRPSSRTRARRRIPFWRIRHRWRVERNFSKSTAQFVMGWEEKAMGQSPRSCTISLLI